MVAAGMTLAHQGIVFAQNADVWAALTVFPNGTEGGFLVADAPLYGEAQLFQLVGAEGGGLILSAVGFVEIEDLTAQVKQMRLLSGHRFEKFFLRHGKASLPNICDNAVGDAKQAADGGAQVAITHAAHQHGAAGADGLQRSHFQSEFIGLVLGALVAFIGLHG